jgi:PAS domain S-box-containing protein
VFLAAGGAAYLGWWFVVHATLPSAFNPFPSRVLASASFFVVLAASYWSPRVARHISAGLTACICLATAHFFTLFHRNNADLNWIIGSYIIVTAAAAVLQTSKALAFYSVFVIALSVAFRPSASFNAIYLPGIVTSLFFANVGLHARLRLLARLEENRKRIESLFDAGFDGIAVHEGGVIRQVNDALAVLLGRTKSELVGSDLSLIFVPESRPLYREMLDDQQTGSGRAVVLRNDGEQIHVDVIMKTHLQNDQSVKQIALRDVTEQRRAQTALEAANHDLESFSYTVAHDLRAPLRAMNGFSRILQEDYANSLDTVGRGHLDQIADGATSMGRLIDALLGLAQVTRKELTLQTVDLTAQAELIMRRLRMMSPERPVIFENQQDVTANGDAELLLVLLDNLLSNAWKFTQQQPPPGSSSAPR